MTDKPIIFSGPMIAALFNGKRQIRRILKPLPKNYGLPISLVQTGYRFPRIAVGGVLTDQSVKFVSGQRLWVRETWNLFCYSQDGDFAWPVPEMPSREEYEALNEEAYRISWGLHYKATPKNSCWDGTERYRPSIHMPRWASRLDMIAEINHYGVVRLSQSEQDGKWHARIKYHSVTPGVTAEAASDFNHSTPQAALADALAVVRNAFAEIGREAS